MGAVAERGRGEEEKKKNCVGLLGTKKERGASGREGRRYHSLHVGTYGKVLDREGEGRQGRKRCQQEKGKGLTADLL